MTIRIPHEEVQRFAAWSADRNPLHVDRAAARATFFGQPVVHGMLSAIRSLGLVEGPPLASLDIEFRGAVFPDADSAVAVAREGDHLTVTVRSGNQTVLVARGRTADSASMPEAGLHWSRSAAEQPLRPAPAVRNIDDLTPGTVVQGLYPAAAAWPALAGALTPGMARVLALTSYIVGMELPGLQSLFTRATFEFAGEAPSAAALGYRAEIVKFDRQFRMLETRVDIAAPDGTRVATATLRSYVRFTPIVTPVAALRRHLSGRRTLAGKVALVCGGTRGLGADLTTALAAAGCTVYASYHRDGEAARALETLLRNHGLDACFLEGDAGDADWCAETLARIEREHGRLDVLVLNACAPPVSAKIAGAVQASADGYIAANLRLARTPLATMARALEKSGGALVVISSSFVEEAPPGFADYVALKQAVETLTHAAIREAPRVSGLIVRPPRLQTAWNDTPTGVLGTIAADRVAAGTVAELTQGLTAGAVAIASSFPEYAEVPAPDDSDREPDFSVVLSASFTAEPVARGLRFWFGELGLHAEVDIAPYGQIIQTLLNPAAGAPKRGLNVVLLRVRDWLRELTGDQAGSPEFVAGYLDEMARDLERAVRTHRAHAAAETVLVLCPGGPGGQISIFDRESRSDPGVGESRSDPADAAIDELLGRVEADLAGRLATCPGLHVVRARDYHADYGVTDADLTDPLREKIAHIPYRDPYLYTLSTIVMRLAHAKLVPARKVVVVDCDNTLWRGVVGEVGHEGIEFDESHRALHERLTALGASGILVCLCSKNEEDDVWRVFENRADFGLGRDRIVAAMINWQPKSENLRRLAARLNLGLDSFVFIDDNPVECAEVRAACPEVLTLEWPTDPAAAIKLLRHTWELAPRRTTAEDARRADMYREEFRRQELQDTLSFREFLNSLELVVDVRPLDAADLRRAAQLTLRTNQFNFTTRRRDEGEMQALLDGGAHVMRTIRVRDRFGDYGLVGLVIAAPQDGRLAVDTFLLSCRVLGRGVEHHLAAELGRIAAGEGLPGVAFRIDFTKRNTPARKFLQAIIPAERLVETGTSLECEVPAAWLANLRFEPADGPGETFDEGDGAAAGSAGDSQGPRAREAQIARTVGQLASADALRDAIDGKPVAAAAAAGADPGAAAAIVHQAFAAALGLPPSRVAEIDSLEALGCDSFKIVEITVALIERFPGLPPTLLFEHRSVSEIAREVGALIAPAAVPSGQVRSDEAPSRSDERDATDIAIVGMHARCAGADSPADLWRLLSEGGVAVAPVPLDRPAFLHPLSDTRPHFAGLLDEVARFDAELFGVAPREAEVMDPQLRLFLEVAWAALEDGGCLGGAHDPDTGVFVGVMYADYAANANLAVRAKELPYRSWESFSLANRLSQLLGFRGPSLSVDTACSSSVTALHVACRALRAGDCNVAVVGGVNLILDPDRFVHLGRLGILSLSGRCLAFGAEADGTALGEGAGAVVLRTLADARRRGDRILGVIKSTGVSTGSGTVGFTAPNPQAQAEAIRRALVAARMDPRTITYVETHGTGTSLGDPIEVRGLTLAHGLPELRDASLEGDPGCGLGSIKPNVGHLEAGAGVLGLIKVLLQFQHEALLPSVTSEELNPQIPFAQTRFHVQRSLEPWTRPVFRQGGASIELPRRAALSSFGVGGSNAHVILEEPPAFVPSASAPERPAHVVALSARTEDALHARANQLAAWLSDHPEPPVADAFFSMNTGRRHLDRRAAVVADSREQAAALLAQVAAGKRPRGVPFGTVQRSSGRPRLAFMCTGQGSQHPRMGAALYETQPVFRDTLDRCAAIFDRVLGTPLLRLLFAEPGSDEAQLLNQTGFTQPALFSYEYALAELWASWGVTPDLVMGHSVGEIAAMCIAGGVSLEDGLTLIAARGTLMQALPAGGAMASIMADEARVAEAIAGRSSLALAAINGPSQVVISGDGTALAEVVAELSAKGIKATPLTVSHAFHSPLMRPMVDDYLAVVRGIPFSAPAVPLVSGVHGRVATDEITTPEYWIRNVLEPVRFTAAMATLAAEGARVYLEVGPQPVLVGMGRHCLPDDESARWIASARRDADAWTTLLGAAGELHAAGIDVDWTAYDAPYARTRVSVPAYPFGGKRHWIAEVVGTRQAPRAGVAASATEEPPPGARSYEIAWTPLSPLVPPAGASGHWIVLADSGGIGAALVRALEDLGGRCTVVFEGPEFDPSRPEDYDRLFREIDGQPVRGVVSTWPTETIGLEAGTPSAEGDPRPATVPEHANSIVTRAVRLVNAVAGLRSANPPKVWFVTRSAVPVEANEPVAVSQSPLWGFGRTAALEHPEVWGGLIDLGAEAGPQDAVALAAELVAGSDDDQVAIRRNARYVPRLGPIAQPATAPVRFDPDAIYLVTGGAGALGQRVCRWLVEKGARRLLVSGRRGDRTPGAAELVASIEKSGATVRVVAADVSRPGDVDDLIAGMRSAGRPGGIFHVAGVERSKPIAELTDEEIAGVLTPKIDGAWLLHERSRGLALDQFVCFSSIASVLGAAGRAHYAAANAFLDALAHERRREGLPALTVNWGPWKGGGMATAAVLEQFERIGNYGLDPAQALAQLELALRGSRPQVGIAAIDWNRFAEAYELRRRRPIVANLVQAPSRKAEDEGSARAPWLDQLARTPVEQRETELARLLQQEVADTLGYDDPDAVSVDRSFQDLGMDSLMSAEFAQRIQKKLGTRATALVFEQPRIATLAPRLLGVAEIGAAGPAAPSTAAPTKTAAGPGAAEPQAEVPAPVVGPIVGYSRDLEPLVFAFQEAAWPNRRRDWIAPRWHWMFVESARRLDLDPQVWLYRDNGRIAGHNGAIPVRVKIGGGERTTAWLVDTMVLEEYRSQAVGARLMVQAHEDLPFALSLGQTKQMRDIQLRLGWEQVAPLQTAQFLIRPERVLKGKLPGGVGTAAGLGLRAANAVRDALRGRSNLDVRTIDRFGAEHDRLWESMAATVTCAVRRDASYLNWKYVEQPGQSFIRLEVREKDQSRAPSPEPRLRGVVVLAVREPDHAYRYRRALLVDLVAPLDDGARLGRLVQAAIDAAAEAGADALNCLHIGEPLTAALRAAGFRLREPERYLLVRPADLDAEARRQALEGRAWFVTQGDSDIDRPW